MLMYNVDCHIIISHLISMGIIHSNVVCNNLSVVVAYDYIATYLIGNFKFGSD